MSMVVVGGSSRSGSPAGSGADGGGGAGEGGRGADDGGGERSAGSAPWPGHRKSSVTTATLSLNPK